MTLLEDTPHTSVSASLAGVRALDDEDLCLAIQDAEAALRRLQADTAVLVAELSARIEAMGHPISGASEELATMLAISPRSADRRMGTAVGLCEREVLWAALFEARIDQAKAVMIMDLLSEIPDPRREELELLAIEFGRTHTGHQLRRKLLALTCSDPDESLRKEAIDRRGVWIRPAGYGMADIHAHLSADHAEIFFRALEQLADGPGCADPHEQGEERNAEQRRADALVGYLLEHTEVSVTVDLIVSADTLIGDNDWTPESKRLGPVASQLARDLCMAPDARWRRVLTDPVTGTLVAMGTQAYRIPEHLRAAIKVRDLTCRFPGCHAPAEHADIDHIVPHPAGPTSPDNLQALCRRHHRTKTHSAWQVTTDTERRTWTSPLGRTYTSETHRYRRIE